VPPPLAGETATIVVIGILNAPLKSFQPEALRRRWATAFAKENGREDWETRVICARNMPWTPDDLDFDRILTTCPHPHHD
jgi:hypothetical protein